MKKLQDRTVAYINIDRPVAGKYVDNGGTVSDVCD